MAEPIYPINVDKTVTDIVAVSGTFTLTLSDVNGILVGSIINVGGLPTASWNGNNLSVTAVDDTASTVRYSKGNFTVAQQEVWGQVHLETTWIADADVINWLGFTPTGADATFLTACTEAANDRCWLWRSRAGYLDHPNVSPGQEVKLGTTMYAAYLYRDRGTSGDTYASFDSVGQFQAPVSMGRVQQLLGVKRPAVG